MKRLAGSRRVTFCSCKRKTIYVRLGRNDGKFCPKCDKDVIDKYLNQGASITRIEAYAWAKHKSVPYDTAGFKGLKQKHPIYQSQKCITCRHFVAEENLCLFLKRRRIKKPGTTILDRLTPARHAPTIRNIAPSINRRSLKT